MPYLRVQQDLQQRLANLLALLAVAPCRHARDVGMRQLRSPTAAAQQTQRARMLWRRQSRQHVGALLEKLAARRRRQRRQQPIRAQP